MRYFQALHLRFGPQHWWPARTRLEVILGAILTQNTAWRNAELALRELRRAGLLRPHRLRLLTTSKLAGYIRPAGFFRQKAGTIRRFLDWLDEQCGGSLHKLFANSPEEIRTRLLAIQGFGPETVDAILLYAGRHPFFVADAYTRRLLVRHRLIAKDADYNTAQAFLHRNLKREHVIYNEYHALIVEVGKQYCVRSAPKCSKCPLQPFLPPSGPA
jgi:endonuclease-3 related protein